MNPIDLQKLKEWRERGGMTKEEYAQYVAQSDSWPYDEDGIHLYEMETNLALAFHDFLMVLGVGDEDIADVLGPENIAWIEDWLGTAISIPDEGVMAFRQAKTLFEPERPLEEYGLMGTTLLLPDAAWDALEENSDERFVFLGPLVLDQNTRTIWMWNGLELESLEGPMRLDADQRAAAVRAMKEMGGGLLEIST